MKTKGYFKIFVVFLFLIFAVFSFNFNVFSLFKQDFKQCYSKKEDEKKTQVKKPEDEELFNLNNQEIGVSAKNGAILIDARTNDVLFALNANLIAPMASTTKIMTAILAIENVKDLDSYFKVDERAIKEEGSSMGLEEEYSVNLKGLLIGMMLSSGNDAANEIAFRVVKELEKNGKIEPLKDEKGKSLKTEKYIEKFVELMNDKALELGLKHTKFSSPSGLGPEDILYSKKFKENQTTAQELSLIASYALKNELFREICAYPRKSVVLKKMVEDEEEEEKEEKEKRWYLNHNKLLRKDSGFFYKFANGVKTGFTKEAGRCLVSSAEKDGVKLIAVVLNASKDWTDCKELFEYGFSKYKKIDLPEDLEEEDKITNKEFKVIGLEGKDGFFKVVQKDPLFIKLTKNMQKNRKITYKIKANSVYFNVSKGEKIGEIEYYLDDYFIDKTDLLAAFDLN